MANRSLQIPQQRENLRLDGDVEGRRRLVREQQLRLACQGHRDHDALALAAGELVWIRVDRRLRLGDPDEAKEIDRARSPFAPRLLPVQPIALRDLPAHPCRPG